MSVSYEFSLQARVFLLGKPFQSSLMLVGKIGAHPSEASLWCSIFGQAHDLTHKLWTRQERLARDKHSGLLQKITDVKFFLQHMALVKLCKEKQEWAMFRIDRSSKYSILTCTHFLACSLAANCLCFIANSSK